MQLPSLFNLGLYLAVAGFALNLTACKELDPVPLTVASSQNLRFVAAYPLEIAEPSGLSLAQDLQSLWTVSDDNNKIYQIDLQGRVLNSFQSERRDLEGITTIDANHLAFISERERAIVVTRKDGSVIESAPIAIPGSDNKGPEALSYDEAAAEFYVVQESPGFLLTLNRELQEVARRELKFALDYSSISFDSKRNNFWVLSDLSRSIHVLNHSLQMQQSYSVNIKQMEGLAINHQARRIYITSDPLAMLYVFEFDAPREGNDR